MEHTIKEEIAKNLLYFRKKRGMTQRELANRLGVKHNSISSWENAVNSVDVDILFQICRILGVTIHDMYGNYAICSEVDYTPQERVLTQQFRSQPALQEAVLRVLQVRENLAAQEYE